MFITSEPDVRPRLLCDFRSHRKNIKVTVFIFCITAAAWPPPHHAGQSVRPVQRPEPEPADHVVPRPRVDQRVRQRRWSARTVLCVQIRVRRWLFARLLHEQGVAAGSHDGRRGWRLPRRSAGYALQTGTRPDRRGWAHRIGLVPRRGTPPSPSTTPKQPTSPAAHRGYGIRVPGTITVTRHHVVIRRVWVAVRHVGGPAQTRRVGSKPVRWVWFENPRPLLSVCRRQEVACHVPAVFPVFSDFGHRYQMFLQGWQHILQVRLPKVRPPNSLNLSMFFRARMYLL